MKRRANKDIVELTKEIWDYREVAPGVYYIPDSLYCNKAFLDALYNVTDEKIRNAVEEALPKKKRKSKK